MSDVEKPSEPSMPASRTHLLSRVAAHVQGLTAGFDQIDQMHRERGKTLVDWIVENYEPGTMLPVIFICTGNSRRSILGATLGNIAAAYYGLPQVRFSSGGTTPGAFNTRSIAALRAIGVEIGPTGRQAEKGAAGEENPVYEIRWGDKSGGPQYTSQEFSKRYDDAHNPQGGFAAVLVCNEADEACPTVRGAAIRIPIPFVDPKAADDTDAEAPTYAARRDEIGRLMMAVMMQARLRLTSAGKL